METQAPISQIVQKVEAEYGATEVPIIQYLTLMGVYTAVFGTLYWAATRKERPLAKPRGLDLGLLTIASYKLTRIITMSFIGSAVRAPFTERGRSLRAGEVQDHARGQGLQRAIGNLVTCPFCFNLWSTTFFVFGFSIWQQFTRQVSYVLSIAAAGDFLHLGYRNVRESSL